MTLLYKWWQGEEGRDVNASQRDKCTLEATLSKRVQLLEELGILSPFWSSGFNEPECATGDL